MDSEEGEHEALEHDYLRDAYGSETALTLPHSTTNVDVDLTRDEFSEAQAKTEPRFINQRIEFPTPDVSSQLLFWGSSHVFKVLYAAATIISDRDQDIVLLAPTNSPIKIWINDHVVMNAAAGSDSNAHLGTKVHLQYGKNPILVKLFCFPLRNNFHIWLATPAAANKFIINQGGLIQPVEHLIIGRSNPLRLTSLARLRYSNFMSSSTSEYRIADGSGTVVRHGSVVDGALPSSIYLDNLPDGLYSLRLISHDYSDQTFFFYGDIFRWADRQRQACTSRNPLTIPCAALPRLLKLLNDPKSHYQLPAEDAVLFLVEQFEWYLGSQPTDRISADHANRVLLRDFRSSLDKTVQYYYMFVPPGHEHDRNVRLVVIIPPLDTKKSFFEVDSTINPFPLQQYAAYAARYNLAFIQPFARGRPIPSGNSETDVLEALSDVRRLIEVDTTHIYAAGDCGGGRGAIILVENHPTLFAGVSTIDAATGIQTHKRSPSQDGANPLLNISRLAGHAITLIHEDPDTHSPFSQALLFKRKAQQVGLNPIIIRLPVDHTYTLRYTREELFRSLGTQP